MNKNWKLLLGNTWMLYEGKTLVAHIMRHGTHSPNWTLVCQGKHMGVWQNPELAKDYAHKALGI